MRRREFEELVRQALEGLPEPFLDRMDNVDVVVQRWPSPQQLKDAGVAPGETLLGLYEGIPLTGRDGYNMVLPDKITLFLRPIEAECDTPQDMAEQVRETVVHEVAHHFGISDEALEEWGLA